MISRRAWIALAVLLVLLAASYGLYWRVMALRLEAGIADWVAWQRQTGAKIEFASDGVHGFPLAFQAEFRSPQVEMALSPEVWLEYSGSAIRAEMRPWNWRDIAFASAGQQQFALLRGGGARDLTSGAQSVRGRVSLYGDGGLAELAIDAQGLNVEQAGFGTFGAASLALRLGLPPQPPEDFKAMLGKVALSAETIVLPTGTVLLDGERVDHVAIEVEIMGPAPVKPLVATLRAWSDAGGVIEARHFAFRQGTLSISGDATIALDQDLQPMVAGRIEAQGLVPALDRLAAQGVIEPGQASLAGVAISALEVPGEGGEKIAKFGFSLQGRLLRLGPVPLMRVPEIRW